MCVGNQDRLRNLTIATVRADPSLDHNPKLLRTARRGGNRYDTNQGDPRVVSEYVNQTREYSQKEIAEEAAFR